MNDTPLAYTILGGALLIAINQSTPLPDRAEAILLIADKCSTMQPEPRHALALVDLMTEPV